MVCIRSRRGALHLMLLSSAPGKGRGCEGPGPMLGSPRHPPWVHARSHAPSAHCVARKPDSPDGSILIADGSLPGAQHRRSAERSATIHPCGDLQDRASSRTRYRAPRSPFVQGERRARPFRGGIPGLFHLWAGCRVNRVLHALSPSRNYARLIYDPTSISAQGDP